MKLQAESTGMEGVEKKGDGLAGLKGKKTQRKQLVNVFLSKIHGTVKTSLTLQTRRKFYARETV